MSKGLTLSWTPLPELMCHPACVLLGVAVCTPLELGDLFPLALASCFLMMLFTFLSADVVLHLTDGSHSFLPEGCHQCVANCGYC